MRVVFMGTPEFSVPSLKALHASFEVVGVYTQPDKPQGRKMIPQAPAVKQCAEELGIPVFQPKNFKDPETIKELESLEPDFLAVIAYGLLLPKAVLEIPKKAAINAHASLLPKHRGASPMQAAILAGDPWTGVTTMLMDLGLDTGDMLLKRKIPLARKRIQEVHDELAQISAELFRETIEHFESIAPEKQDPSEATFTTKLTREHGLIDLAQSAEDIERAFRAYYPWPGITLLRGGKRLKIHGLSLIEGPSDEAPGTVTEIAKEGIIIATGQGLIRLESLQPEGKRPMSAWEYQLGHNLKKGDQL